MNLFSIFAPSVDASILKQFSAGYISKNGGIGSVVFFQTGDKIFFNKKIIDA